MTQLDHPIVQTINELVSQDPQRMRAGEARLAEWVHQPGYHSTLLEIGYSQHLPHAIRLASLILFKNNIDKYWRKTATNGISVEEKGLIRSQLLNFFNESQMQLQSQNAVIVGKIARLDFPNDWPSLIPDLLSRIHACDGDSPELLSALGRVLATVHSVIKALSSKTLALSRRQFEEASPAVLQLLTQVYDSKFRTLKDRIESHQLAEVSELIRVTHYCLKITRRLLVYGFKLPFSQSLCCELFEVYLDHLNVVYNFIKTLPEEHQHRDPLIKLALLIGKIYLQLQHHHAIPFVNQSKFHPLMLAYWTILNDLVNNENDQLEKLIVQSLKLYKEIIFNYYYMVGEKETPTPDLIQARTKINDELLTDEFLFRVVELIMTRYMTLRPHSDLAAWEEDPQTWLLEEMADPWEFKSRACAEKVIISTVARDKAKIGPFLAQLVHKFSGPANTLDELLVKDAVYNACGLASHELFDYLDFDTWFKERLTTEVHQDTPGHWVLKFRIAWLVGKWVGVKIPKSTRPLVYEMLVRLMQPGTDGPSTIVQLTAISALRDCVDDWDFEPERFLPYLEQILPLLSQALVQVDEIELKMKVVNCLSIIVERMEQHIAPFAGAITALLPRLWQLEGEGENLLKSSIVTMVSKLVGSIKGNSDQLIEIIVPIVRHSTDLNNEAHIYLLEDGVDLWLAALTNAHTLTSPLLEILPCALPLLTIGSEVLAKVLLIVESYLLLDAERTLNTVGAPLFNTLSSTISEVRSEAITKISRIIETAMILAPAAPLQQLFVETGFLSNLIDLVLKTDEPPFNQTKYLTLLSRFVMWDGAHFLNFIGFKFGDSAIAQLQQLLEVWIDRIDVMIDSRHRKLSSLALAALLATPPTTAELGAALQPVYAALPQFMTVWTSCLADVEEFDTGDSLVYHTEYQAQTVEHLGDDQLDEDIPEDARRKALPDTDPVFGTHLKSAIWASLERAQAAAPSAVTGYLNQVDPLVVDQIKP